MRRLQFCQMPFCNIATFYEVRYGYENKAFPNFPFWARQDMIFWFFFSFLHIHLYILGRFTPKLKSGGPLSEPETIIIHHWGLTEHGWHTQRRERDGGGGCVPWSTSKEAREIGATYTVKRLRSKLSNLRKTNGMPPRMAFFPSKTACLLFVGVHKSKWIFKRWWEQKDN